MKGRVLGIAYVVLLAGGGATMVGYQLRTFAAPDEEVRISSLPSSGAIEKPTGPFPIAELVDGDYDFGLAENGTKGMERSFIVRNKGEAPLKITHFSLSCNKCTRVATEPLEIAPGGQAAIVVQWDLDRKPDEREFRQSVKIHTDDPSHLILEAVFHGRVVHALVPSQNQIVFGAVSPREGGAAEIALQAFLDSDLQITGHSFSDQSTASYFEVTDEPLSADKLDASAKCGARLIVKVKPGLPLGAFAQTLKIATNLPKAPSLEIPITGEVRDDRVSFAGGAYLRGLGEVNLKAFPRSRGAKTTINLFLNGKTAKEVTFGAPAATADFIKVIVHDTKPLGEEQSVSKIDIIIEPDTASGNFLGTEVAPAAEITIPTNHPDFGDIKLKVRFAVEG